MTDARGDKIDVSKIDANLTKSHNQVFKLDASGDGVGKTGQLCFWIEDGVTHVVGCMDKDPEHYLQIAGAVELRASDFML